MARKGVESNTAIRSPSRRDFIDAALLTAQRFVDLAVAADTGDLHVPATPAWTVTDVVGHVAMEPARYHALANGGGDWPHRAADLPAFNARQISELPTRDRKALGEILLSELSALLQTVDRFGTEAPMMNFDGDQRIKADVALGTLIGEFVVHGHDIARVLGRNWTIEPELVPLIMRGQHQVMPGWVNAASADRHTATYDFRLRGLESYIYEFTAGTLTINPSCPRRIDVHISAEPVTALMMSYGRARPVMAALTGKLTSWGRKPWLAPRFASRFLPA